MDEDICVIILCIVICSLAFFGAVFLVADYRYFRDISSQCEKQGFIQNETIRIKCTVEKP